MKIYPVEISEHNLLRLVRFVFSLRPSKPIAYLCKIPVSSLKLVDEFVLIITSEEVAVFQLSKTC